VLYNAAMTAEPTEETAARAVSLLGIAERTSRLTPSASSDLE
jgi:hypothetical protein